MLLAFLVLYVLAIGVSFVSQYYKILTFQVEEVSYLFVLFLFVIIWVNLAKEITFYSYQSMTRKEILYQSMTAQLLICFLASIVIEGINQLIFRLDISNFTIHSDAIRIVYLKEFKLNMYLEIFLAILILTIGLFTVSQIANAIAIATYSWKRSKLLIVLSSLLIILVALIVSFSFWTRSMYVYFVKALGWLSGTGQHIVPTITIPIALMLLVLALSMMFEVKKIKKIEINKFIA